MRLDAPQTIGVKKATAPRLEVRNVSCTFDGREVVRNVSFQVEPGEIMCLLGPSGCGKSTTLRVVAGIERQSAGSVHADGKMLCNEVFATPPEARGVGLIFQDFALFPHLTVGQNIAFGLKGSKSEMRARVDELLERVDLAGYADKTPHMLSGGEQQRVALARALAPRPRIMLMDEPFSGLDNRLRDGIRDETLQLLKEEGTAVVLVTHEPEEAMRMADQIALMRDGQIVQKGAPYNIYNAPCDKAAAAFFSDINVIRGRVEGLLTNTVFGQFLAPAVADGAEVEIVFRPQHVKLDFDRNGRGPNPTPQDGVPARGVVERARFMGHESLVEFRMDFDGGKLKATVPGVFLPKPGTPLWLSVRRDRCFVFPPKG
ncbi:ABC transporter ATP-binding protein [Roseibacterium beibuensis]|uniref:ABC transporter ATP-binding protein n=1 Tax=[Roseibacterium] beibuensis TaxID=1193142 RepID=A0ABP9LB23_9RHOB